MNKIKNTLKNLTTKVNIFYSTNRMQKLAVSAVAAIVVAGAVIVALLYTPVISPLINANVSNSDTVSKDAEKDKIANDKEKPSDKDKKDDVKTDETKDEVKDDANADNSTDTKEDSVAPENKPSTASTDNQQASNQTNTAPVHEHNWEPNMVTIPGHGGVTSDEYILGETQEWTVFKWADGCERKLREFTTVNVDAEHTAQHGEYTFTTTTEYVEIEPQVIHTIIEEAVPDHQEQHGWKCSCGATKE